MPIDVIAAMQRIDAILLAYRTAASGSAVPSLLPAGIQTGKLYEAWVLAAVLVKLASEEGYLPILRGSTKPTLRSAPGPIDHRYPYFELWKRGRSELEVWTDIEFLTLSYAQQRLGQPPRPGDYHELDIVVVPPTIQGRPSHDQIRIGIECKATNYGKNLLREILGVRRELSFLHNPAPTSFVNWPRSNVPANPPSSLLVFCTDASVLNYADPGDVFGIDFFHEVPPLQP